MNEPAPKVPSIAVDLDDDDEAETRIFRPESGAAQFEGETQSGIRTAPPQGPAKQHSSAAPRPVMRTRSSAAPRAKGVPRPSGTARSSGPPRVSGAPRPSGVPRASAASRPTNRAVSTGARPSIRETESTSARPTAPPEEPATPPISDETKVFRPPPDLIEAASRKRAEKAAARQAESQPKMEAAPPKSEPRRISSQPVEAEEQDKPTELMQVSKELIYEARKTRARTLHRLSSRPPNDGEGRTGYEDELNEADSSEPTNASRRKTGLSPQQTVYIQQELAGSRRKWTVLGAVFWVIMILCGGCLLALQFGLGTRLFP